MRWRTRKLPWTNRVRRFVKKAFQPPQPHHESPPCLSPPSDPLVPPFRLYAVLLGFNFFGFETKLAGNAATRATLRPSTSLGLGGQYLLSYSPKRRSYLILTHALRQIMQPSDPYTLPDRLPQTMRLCSRQTRMNQSPPLPNAGQRN